MIRVEAWQVAGTVGAIVFGTVGATVAITKLIWDRRDRELAEQRKAEEAELLAHERERLRREQAEWQAADQAQDEASRLRIYSEAEAREFLSQPGGEYPAVGGSPSPGKSGGIPVGMRVGFGVVFLACVAAGVLWVLLR
jgi:CO/xanthine dehydrogenase Mo-binding subunit